MKSNRVGGVFSFLLIGLFLISCMETNAQVGRKGTPDPRLKEVFSTSKLEKMSRKDPARIDYLNFFLDQSWFVSDGANEKAVIGTDINQVRSLKGKKETFSEDFGNLVPGLFNPLKYDFTIHPTHYTYYLLGETGKVLVFYPQYILDEKFARVQSKISNHK